MSEENKESGWGWGSFTGYGAAFGATLSAAAQAAAAQLGFTSAGVAAGSIAAGLQGSAVVSGSGFAIMQSIGATAALVSAPVLGVAVGCGAAVGGLAYLYNSYANSDEVPTQKKETFTGKDPVNPSKDKKKKKGTKHEEV